jgi:hypothetical protein
MEGKGRSKTGIALLVLLALTACASETLHYGPRTATTAGYEDIQLGESTWQVRLTDVRPAGWPDLEKFALYRAAEMTKAQGGVAFEVLGAAQQLHTYDIPVARPTMTWGTTITPDGRVLRYDTVAPFYSLEQPWRQFSSTYYLDYRILGPAEAAKAPNALRQAQVMQDLGVFIQNRRQR